MKIVHIVEPLAGGIVTFIKSLVENLPNDVHIIIHGERIQVMPFAEVKKQFVYPNVKFLRWKSAQRNLKPHKDIAAALELFSILKRLKKSGSLDVVHLHSSKGGFLGRVVCRMLNIQHLVLYTPNGAPFLSSEKIVTNFIYKNLEKLGTKFGGQVVCCSPSEQQAYESAGISTLMINNGTPHKNNFSLPTKSEKRKVFRIITSGRIVNQKNPAMFNRIAAYFEEFEQFEFLWAGDGTERDYLTAKNIKVTGWLATPDLNNLVSTADIYLSTATFEGLPFSVLEALALRKPVLLTECVGNKDLVMKGLNGSVFRNEAEAITQIIQFYNNSSMLKVMGEHSGAYCKNSFNHVDTYNGYNRLYKKTALA